MLKSIIVLCTVLVVSGCSSIQPSSDQQAVLDNLQVQLTTLVQDNDVIQKGTAAYQTNKAKIEEIQQKIQFYQDQIQKAKDQVQAAQDKAVELQGTAQDYTEQGKGLLHKLGEKLQDL